MRKLKFLFSGLIVLISFQVSAMPEPQFLKKIGNALTHPQSKNDQRQSIWEVRKSAKKVSMNNGRQQSQDNENTDKNDVREYSTSVLNGENFVPPVVSIEPDPSYTFVQTDSLNKRGTYLKTYKKNDGSLISLFFIDNDNYCWLVPKTVTDEYTGEPKIVVDGNNGILSFKRVLKDVFYTRGGIYEMNKDEYPEKYRKMEQVDTIVYDGQKTLFSTSGKVPICIFQKKEYSEFPPYLSYDKMTTDYGSYNPNMDTSHKAVIFYNGRWMPCLKREVAKEYNLSPLNGHHFAYDKENDEFIVLRCSGINPTSKGNRTIPGTNSDISYKIKIITLPSDEKILLPLPITFNKTIKKIDQKGKIFTIHFDDTDFITLSTLANEIMSANITTSEGILNFDGQDLIAKPNRDYLRLQYHNIDSSNSELNRFEVIIPANSTCYANHVTTSNLKTLMEPVHHIVATSWNITDPDNNKIYNNDKWCNEASEVQKRRDEIYAPTAALIEKYKSKYGNSVNTLINWRTIETGAKFALYQDVCEVKLLQTVGNQKIYEVKYKNFDIDPQKGTIRTILTGGGSTFRKRVVVVNGIVKSVRDMTSKE